MSDRQIDIGEQFAVLTGMLEDACMIAVEGQRTGLSAEDAGMLIEQLRQQIARIEMQCDLIADA